MLTEGYGERNWALNGYGDSHGRTQPRCHHDLFLQRLNDPIACRLSQAEGGIEDGERAISS